jgi:hypothetical protein
MTQARLSPSVEAPVMPGPSERSRFLVRPQLLTRA